MEAKDLLIILDSFFLAAWVKSIALVKAAGEGMVTLISMSDVSAALNPLCASAEGGATANGGFSQFLDRHRQGPSGALAFNHRMDPSLPSPATSPVAATTPFGTPPAAPQGFWALGTGVTPRGRANPTPRGTPKPLLLCSALQSGQVDTLSNSDVHWVALVEMLWSLTPQGILSWPQNPPPRVDRVGSARRMRIFARVSSKSH